MREEWRKVSVRPDRYEVSSLGRVRSVIGDKTHVLKPYVVRDGYHRYTFRISGKNKYFEAHRLVAQAFLGDPTGPYVRHLDGNPGNNVPANLAYGTASENNFDTVRHGHNWQRSKTACVHGHVFDDANTYVHRGLRSCRECNRRAVAAYKAAQS